MNMYNLDLPTAQGLTDTDLSGLSDRQCLEAVLLNVFGGESLNNVIQRGAWKCCRNRTTVAIWNDYNGSGLIQFMVVGLSIAPTLGEVDAVNTFNYDSKEVLAVIQWAVSAQWESTSLLHHLQRMVVSC